MIPVLLCIFIQTSGEDVLFKGYYLRQLGAVTRIFWVAPVLVAAIFVAAHIGNPDVVDKLWILVPVFFINELFIIYLTIRTGGMEIPLVLHWFNNTMIMLFLAERTTQANDLTLWVFDKPLNAADYEASDIVIVITALIFNGFFLLAFCWSRSPFYVPPVTEQEPPTEKGL